MIEYVPPNIKEDVFFKRNGLIDKTNVKKIEYGRKTKDYPLNSFIVDIFNIKSKKPFATISYHFNNESKIEHITTTLYFDNKDNRYKFDNSHLFSLIKANSLSSEIKDSFCKVSDSIKFWFLENF